MCVCVCVCACIVTYGLQEGQGFCNIIIQGCWHDLKAKARSLLRKKIFVLKDYAAESNNKGSVPLKGDDATLS